MIHSSRILAGVAALLTIVACSPATASDPSTEPAPEWIESMAKVHERFRGEPGTFAQFGDSITVTMAFWAPLEGEVQGLSGQAASALSQVKQYMQPKCWREWKGPRYGSEGGMTIRWAHEHIDEWLRDLNPEVALLMFGTNDLGHLELAEYEQKTRAVVRRCLDNGTIVILNTIPPFSGRQEQASEFAAAVRKIAADEKVPLVDYHAEILQRQPDDWDGTLEKFKAQGIDEYQVPTLISGDGVHPSYPRQYEGDFSQAALNASGYNLRSYLVLLAYAEVLQRVLRKNENSPTSE